MKQKYLRQGETWHVPTHSLRVDTLNSSMELEHKLTFADIILDFAKSLSGFLMTGSNLRRARNQDISGLLERTGICLATIWGELNAGKEPTAQCHELLLYSQLVPCQLRKASGFWARKGAASLSGYLDAAVDAPSRAVFNLQRKSDLCGLVLPKQHLDAEPSTPEAEMKKIAEASGLFIAAATLVRSGAGLKVKI
jgi:hypothetical protein